MELYRLVSSTPTRLLVMFSTEILNYDAGFSLSYGLFDVARPENCV